MNQEEEKEPWRPHLDTLPLFNPFEPSTKWTAQIGAGDEIKVEDVEEPDEIDPTHSSTEEVVDVK